MKEVLGLFKVELKALHKDGLKNASLNRKSISMIGTLSKYLNKHFNGYTNKVNFKKKLIKKDS